MKIKRIYPIIGLLVFIAIVYGIVYYKSRFLVPKDIILDQKLTWSKPQLAECSWNNMQGEQKTLKGYKVNSSVGRLNLSDYQSLMESQGWRVDDWLEATVVGMVMYSKDDRYVSIEAESYPKGDPSSEFGILTICYSK